MDGKLASLKEELAGATKEGKEKKVRMHARTHACMMTRNEGLCV